MDPDSPHLDLLPPQQLLGLHYLGQETSRRGEISLDSSVFFPVEGDRQLRRKSPPGGKVALVSPVICSDFVGNLAFLGCADGKKFVHEKIKKSSLKKCLIFLGTLLVFDTCHCAFDCHFRLAFTPSLVRAHSDGAVVVVAGEKGFVQCFDLALNNIR